MDRDQALNVAHHPGNPANYHHSVKDEALAVLAEIVERAVEMLPHEKGFGGDVAHHIVHGTARKGRTTQYRTTASSSMLPR